MTNSDTHDVCRVSMFWPAIHIACWMDISNMFISHPTRYGLALSPMFVPSDPDVDSLLFLDSAFVGISLPPTSHSVRLELGIFFTSSQYHLVKPFPLKCLLQNLAMLFSAFERDRCSSNSSLGAIPPLDPPTCVTLLVTYIRLYKCEEFPKDG